MSAEDGSASRHADGPVVASDPREDLVRRVVSSVTFEKSPKLRAFLQYVCRCALDEKPAAATEQQIGIYVFHRQPGYNANEDNIVRSQARLLRLKLEHHFANEGKDESIVITIPKGRYLPVFDNRHEQPAVPTPKVAKPAERHWRNGLISTSIAIASIVGVAILWVATAKLRSKESLTNASGAAMAQPDRAASRAIEGTRQAVAPVEGEIRIAAGLSDGAYIDGEGRRWEADQFYQGGIAKEGPRDLFPPVPNPDLFKSMREGATADSMAPATQSQFRYDIPVPPGVYQLHLYFADPLRRTALETQEDAQNVRHFHINVNGRPLLSGFDSTADAGSAPIDIRVFKDIAPAADGKVHLEFIPGPERPFLNALELTPGVPGKLKPIRFTARKTGLVAADGTRWSADNYYVGGRTGTYVNSDSGPKVDDRYTHERFGNFSYAIPVPPGSYTVKLHFLETFFSPSTAPSGICRGAGCRVFDVTCNGVELLKDFDISRAADGEFKPVIRTFRKLRPNAQGKLFLTFWPKVNYAEVRAIEVIDEAQ